MVPIKLGVVIVPLSPVPTTERKMEMKTMDDQSSSSRDDSHANAKWLPIHGIYHALSQPFTLFTCGVLMMMIIAVNPSHKVVP